MANKCVNLSDKKAKEIKKELEKAKVDTTGLSKIQIENALGKVADFNNVTVEALLEDENLKLFIHALGKTIKAGKAAATKEKETIAKYVENKSIENKSKVGNADLVVVKGKTWNKSTPRKNPTTVYVFGENAQAYAKTTGENVEGLIEPKDGVEIDVNSSSAIVRADNRGANKNARGLVVKPNAQDEEGKWIGKRHIDAESKGVFQDTNGELTKFVDINTKILDRLAEDLGITGAKNKPEIEWAKSIKSNSRKKSYEVSSKGDKRFSAFYAKFAQGTTLELNINGKNYKFDVGGKSIEWCYQVLLKGRKDIEDGKGQGPAEGSPLYNSAYLKASKEEQENYSYKNGYIHLWEKWAEQNPELMEELAKKAEGKVLTDKFAETLVNQARALAEILNRDRSKTAYSRMEITEYIATDNAGLPKRFAEKLKELLEEKLGIISEVVDSDFGDNLYGLKINSVVKSTKPKSDKKTQESKEKQKTKKERAEELLAEERPIREEDVPKELRKSLLSELFPNIAQRKARIAMMSDMFSQVLSRIVERRRNQLNRTDNDNLDFEELELKRILNEEPEEIQRRAILGTSEWWAEGNGKGVEKPVPQYIIDSIHRDLKWVVDSYNKAIENDDKEAMDKLIQGVFFDNRSFLFNDFDLQARQEGWNTEKQWAVARDRIKALANAFDHIVNTDNAFQVLLNAAADDIEFFENVRFSATLDRVIESNEDLENEDKENEGSVDSRSGLGLVKHKLVDPIKTASTRIKALLGKQYKVRFTAAGGNKYVFNDLGMRVRMNYGVVYYKLLDTFSKMNSPKDFFKIMDKAIEKYPWLIRIKDQLEDNPDLRNEFFRAMRKVFIKYAVITQSGRIQYLNQQVSTQAFLEALIRNYEGGFVIGPNSIYDSEGKCDENNVKKLRNWLAAPTKQENYSINDPDYIKNHPLYWVSAVLTPWANKKVYTVQNVRKALDLLWGEHKDKKDISLETVLNNIGIETDNVNFDALLPYISDRTWKMIENPKEMVIDAEWEAMSEEEQKDERELRRTLAEKESALERLEVFFTPEQMDNIRQILNAIKGIVHKETGYNKKVHLVSHNKSRYLIIANRLPMISEGYSLSSFFFDKKSRYSYTSPDYISKLVGIIQKVNTKEDIEEAKKFLEEEFGQFNFFKDSLRWRSPALKELAEDEIIRKNFDYINVLATGADKDTIAKAKDKDFLSSIISAFFRGHSQGGHKFGWFRNPLFSDSDALVMFRMVCHKDTFPNHEGYFKKVLLEKLKDVFLQELDRIRDARKGLPVSSKNVDVENYDKNAKNFCFFSAFKGQEDWWLEQIARISDKNSDPASFATERDQFIKERLQQMMDSKVERFKDSFTDDEKSELYEKIYEGGENDEEKEAEQDEQDNEKEINQNEQSRRIQLVDEALEVFYYNDYYTQSQLIQLLFGDLAYAKNVRDFIKRNKQAYACGEKLFALDEEGNPLMERAIYVEDRYEAVNTWSSIKTLLESMPLASVEKDMIKGALRDYINICATDGQSLRSIHSFRTIYKAMGGKWTPGMERAYNNIINGEFGYNDFNIIWNAIKPFMKTYEVQYVNGRREKIPTQHKNSEYLIAGLHNMLQMGLSPSPELEGLHRFMEKHNIDVVHFHSVVKVGHNSPFDINYNQQKFVDTLRTEGSKFKVGQHTFTARHYDAYREELNDALEDGKITQDEYNAAIQRFAFKSADEVFDQLEGQLTMTTSVLETDNDPDSPTYGQEIEKTESSINETMIKEFPLEDICIVQPTDDHYLDAVAVFGSQLRNIIPADFSKNFTVNVTIGNKKVTLNREQAVEYYNMLIVDQLLDSFSAVDAKFADIKALKRFLDSEIANNPRYGDDVKAALELNEDGTAFRMPFNSPNLTNKIESLLLSAFKNAIQRQKINGGNIVLVSNFGRSDTLKTKYINDDPKQGIEYIPAYMPGNMKILLEDYLIEQTETVTDKNGNKREVTYYTVDIEALKKNSDEDLLKLIGYRIPTEDKYSIIPIKIVGFLPISQGTSIMLPSEIITMSGTDFDIDKLFLMIRNSTRYAINAKAAANRFEQWAEEIKEELTPEELKDFSAALELEEDDAEDALVEAKAKKDTVEEELDKILKKLRSRKVGFTASEIYKMINSSPLFARFFDEEYDNIIFKHRKYVAIEADPVYKTDEKGNPTEEIDLDATSRMKGVRSKILRKKIRDNMLIDIIWGFITSPEGARLSMMPATYARVKHSSRQQRILDNREALEHFLKEKKEEIKKRGLYLVLDSMSKEQLEDFFDQYATPDDALDIMFYVASHRNLMDGNDLIGALAVNSSSHYKFQFATLSIKEPFAFSITVPEKGTVRITKIDEQRSPITEELIGRICAEFQAASPDNGKDPNLGDLKASLTTVFRIDFLTRIGLPPEIIGYLNNSDDLRKVGKALRKEGHNSVHSTWNGDINKIVEMIAEVRMHGNVSQKNENDAIAFADWMDNIDYVATSLNMATAFSRADSPNGALGTSTAEAIQQLLLAEDFDALAGRPEFPVEGLDKIVDLKLNADNFRDSKTGELDIDGLRKEIKQSPIPRLQAFYTLGIRSAFTICARYLPQLHPNVIEAVRLLRVATNDLKNQKFVRKRGLKVVKDFLNEMTMFLLTSPDTIFSSDESGKTLMEKRNYYIHNFPMKFSAFLKERTATGKLAHKDIKDLTIIKMLDNKDKKGIKFINIAGKVSQDSRKYFMEDLEYMLKHKDAKVVKFAVDLFMYAFFNDGLTFGKNNYGVLYSTAFLEAVPRYIERLVALNGEVMSNRINMQRFVDQFLLNHPEELPVITGKDFDRDTQDGNIITIIKKRINRISVENKAGSSSIPKFIAQKNTFKQVIGVYALITDERGNYDLDNLQYKKIDYRKKSYNDLTPYYDATKEATEIKWSELKPRGEVIKLSSEQEKSLYKNSIDGMPSEEEDPTLGIKRPKEEEDPTLGITMPKDDLTIEGMPDDEDGDLDYENSLDRADKDVLNDNTDGNDNDDNMADSYKDFISKIIDSTSIPDDGLGSFLDKMPEEDDNDEEGGDISNEPSFESMPEEDSDPENTACKE